MANATRITRPVSAARTMYVRVLTHRGYLRPGSDRRVRCRPAAVQPSNLSRSWSSAYSGWRAPPRSSPCPRAPGPSARASSSSASARTASRSSRPSSCTNNDYNALNVLWAIVFVVHARPVPAARARGRARGRGPARRGTRAAHPLVKRAALLGGDPRARRHRDRRDRSTSRSSTTLFDGRGIAARRASSSAIVCLLRRVHHPRHALGQRPLRRVRPDARLGGHRPHHLRASCCSRSGRPRSGPRASRSPRRRSSRSRSRCAANTAS